MILPRISESMEILSVQPAINNRKNGKKAPPAFSPVKK